MVKISTLLDGYQNFYKKYFIENPEFYQKLVKEGQNPRTLVIACSDSRVDPSILLNTKPGDIFVICNVASLVPPYENDDSSCHGTSAAIEYAVKHLNVENIVVIGHSDCGGIKSLMKEKQEPHSFINHWLSIADEAKQNTLSHKEIPSHHCELCEKEAIRCSVRNLQTFPFIKEKLAQGLISLHGWYFNMNTGSIEIIASSD